MKTTSWGRNPVDQFILATLEKKGLQPAGPADPRRLVRRIYFDLIGLPPAPAEVEAFVEAAQRAPEQAVAQLVERLLASPHHGERWGRHWLDVARYADSNGQEGDQDRPTAYHYRDFVIRAFNDDLPFDRFARWQLAGDELEPDNPEAIAATGFIVAGPHTVLDVPMEEEKIRNRFNELDDMLSTTGQALLGLTLGCARCHDHKYDAIPTRDYYRMQSAFLSGNRAEVPLVTQAEAAEYRRLEAAWKQELAPVRKKFDAWLAEQKKPLTAPLRAAKIDALPIGGDEKILLMNDPDAPRAKELARKHAKALKLEDHEFRKLVSGAQGAEWDRRARELEAIEARKPKAPPTALAMADFGPSP